MILEPFEGFRLEAGYAYLDAKVKESNVPGCDATRFACVDAAYLLPGDELVFSPKNRLTVTGTYTLPLDESIGKISLGATFVHTDRQYASHSPDHAFSIGAIPFHVGRVPATDLLTLNLNWADVGGAPIDIALFATNVTNQNYRVASANGLSTLGADFAILGEPRMFGARLKFRFGD